MAEDRAGHPAFLVYCDDGGRQRTFVLDATLDRVRIGRGTAAELRLAWDREVSRVHAELERIGKDWALIDDGLSANGTYLNGDRLVGRRRLCGGDRIRVGATTLAFRTIEGDGSETFVPVLEGPPVELSAMQRRVLVALCRPYSSGSAYGTPATNQAIAEELYLSVDAVKTHLRTLFRKFAIGELPQNQKRARLVELALERHVVGERDP